MKQHDIRYLTREGIRNTWQNRFMALASVGVLICCLLLTGSAYMVFENMEHMFRTAYEQNVVAVYMEKGADTTVVSQAAQTLKTTDNVAQVTFISKDELLTRYGTDLPEETVESFQGDQNPLPDTFIVSMADLDLFQPTLDTISAIPGVEDVSYDGDVAATLLQVRRLVMGIGGVVALVLLAVSLFIIANTIKLTVHNRRLEIYIMKSVGATDSFVRFPFVVEGVLLGFIAGGVGYGLLYVLYALLVRNITFRTPLFSFVPFAEVWWVMLLFFLVGGILVGTVGSTISMSRYLKREGGDRE